MAAPTCPLLTAQPCSAAETSGASVPELRAYKLGHSRWSYNRCEVKLFDGAGRTAAVVHAAANGTKFAADHQDSAVGFLLQLENGAKVQAHIFLVYPDACPASQGAAAAARGGGDDDEQFAWSLVTRAHCCKSCSGAALRSIQRFGRVGPRQTKAAAAGQPQPEPAAATGRKQPARKDPRFMYLSLDEACTHVGARAFRLVAGIYNRQGTRLLGTAVSPPIRVLANNDAPSGAAHIVLEATLPSDWEGWSGGSGSAGAKRSAAAQPAHRSPKKPSAEEFAASPAAAAAQQWQQLQGPVSPVPRPIVRQPSLPPHPPSPLVLGGGSSCPPSHPPSPLVLAGSSSVAAPADAAPADELWAAVPPMTLAAQLAPSLPFYGYSQLAAQHEAERQITLLQQLKVGMAAVGSTPASSCGSQWAAVAGWGGSGGGGAVHVGAEPQPCWLPGTPLTGPGLSPLLRSCTSLVSADTTLSAACAVAVARAGSVAGSGSPGGSLPPPPPPSPPALEPGLGLGAECNRECSSLEDDLDLQALHSLMGDFGDCGLGLGVGSIFDGGEGFQDFAI